MKYWLLLLTICFLLDVKVAEGLDDQKSFDDLMDLQGMPLSPAPLISIETEYPLGLTRANHQFLVNPKRLVEEKEKIQSLLAKHTFPWLTLIALLASGGIGWTAYITREYWLKRPPKRVTPLSPKHQADLALAELEGSILLAGPESMQSYYTKLGSILSNTLQAYMGQNERGLTTFELVQALKDQSTLPQIQQEEILLILTEIDKVKFAGQKPSIEDAKQMLQKVKSLIIQWINTFP